MASHSRKRSKGAFYILSIDSFRSFSRNGSVQAPDVGIARSPSSHSCNLHGQQTVSPHSPTEATELTGLTLTDPDPKRRRPLSWLSLRSRRLCSRRTSVRLPKVTSSSAMGRSIISAPVLTSTSNSKVAAVEGVQCRETFNRTTAMEARHLAERIEAESVHHRRLIDALRSKLRKRHVFTKIEEEAGSGISRRRAETVNLCREKIKNLTGNGRVERKSITNTNSATNTTTTNTEHLLYRRESQATLINRETSQAAHEFDTELQPDDDSHFGSLTRSFNSALEKLDFHKTILSRSRSSLFNMRAPGEQQEGVPSVDPYNPPKTPRPAFRELPGQALTVLPVTSSSIAGQAGITTTTGVGLGISGLQGKMTRTATQLHFSQDEGYTPAPPTAYPGTNALTMHTAPMDMARARTGTEENTMTITTSSDDEDGGATLEDAIISPSVGKLSYYSSSSVAAKPGTPEMTPSKAENKGKGKVDNAKGEQNRSSILRKSESVLSPIKQGETTPIPARSSSLFSPSTRSPLRSVAIAKEREVDDGMP